MADADVAAEEAELAEEVEEVVEDIVELEEELLEEEFVAVGGAAEIKLFGKWSFDDIEVRDISLVVRTVLCCAVSFERK